MPLVRSNICAWVCQANAPGTNPGGPVWDRPLREKCCCFRIRRRGDPCGRPKAFPLGGKVPSECEADEGAGCPPLCRAAISRPLRKLPSSLRRGAMRPPVEVSAPCRAREGELPCKGKRDRPEPRLSAPRTSAGRPVSGPYEKGGTASVYAVGAAHRAARPAFPLPGGRCPSAHTGADEGEPVGRGLKVNRPKAERSHPGVCPRRYICEFCPGPLRKNRDNLFPNPAEAGHSPRNQGILSRFPSGNKTVLSPLPALSFPYCRFVVQAPGYFLSAFSAPSALFAVKSVPFPSTRLCANNILCLIFSTLQYIDQIRGTCYSRGTPPTARPCRRLFKMGRRKVREFVCTR